MAIPSKTVFAMSYICKTETAHKGDKGVAFS